jgi:hypothetical protein
MGWESDAFDNNECSERMIENDDAPLIGLHYSQLGRLAASEMMSSVDCDEIGERLRKKKRGRGVKDWKFGGRAHDSRQFGFRYFGRKWAWLQARTRGGDDEEEVSKLFFLVESSQPNNYIHDN